MNEKPTEEMSDPTELEALFMEASDCIATGEDGGLECSCCGMEIHEDGTGHSDTCLAEKILGLSASLSNRTKEAERCDECNAELSYCGERDEDGEPMLDCRQCQLVNRVESLEAKLESEASATRCERCNAELSKCEVTSRVDQLKSELRDLHDQIGYLPEGTHPDERKPRAVTWLQERANGLSEIEALRRELKERDERIKLATERAQDIIEDIEGCHLWNWPQPAPLPMGIKETAKAIVATLTGAEAPDSCRKCGGNIISKGAIGYGSRGQEMEDDWEECEKCHTPVEAHDTCDVPPKGWACSRKKGHSGPCAASESSTPCTCLQLGCQDCKDKKVTVYKLIQRDWLFFTNNAASAINALLEKPGVVIESKTEMTLGEYFSIPASNESAVFFGS